MGVGMATTNLFGHPAFKDGAFTSNDRAVRRAAIGKAMRAIDLGGRLGAEVFVFWGGREGTEVGTAKDPRDALERYREAIDVLVDYSLAQGHEMRFALEPKPNEPRGDIFLPTVGHALHFITMLARPDMVGVNPEVAHETMAGLSFHHGVGQALWAGKLFHIDLNGQRIGRYDQDFRFGAEDLKEAFHLVRLLERAGYAGPLHFDAHAYRTEDADGVWEFARGCMAHVPRPRGRGASASTRTPTCARRSRRPPWRSWASRPSAATTPRRSRPRRRARRARGARVRQRAAGPARRRGPARRADERLGRPRRRHERRQGARRRSETGEVARRAPRSATGSRRRARAGPSRTPADWWRATRARRSAALARARRRRRSGCQRPDARPRRARRGRRGDPPGDPLERPAHGRASAARSRSAWASSGSSS